jgi:hypothetical protein
MSNCVASAAVSGRSGVGHNCGVSLLLTAPRGVLLLLVRAVRDGACVTPETLAVAPACCIRH